MTSATAAEPVDDAIPVNDLARFRHTFDGIDPWHGKVENGIVMNFLGVKRSVGYFIGEERKPLAFAENGPYDFTCECPEITDGEVYFEWLDVFEAVRAARDSFTMVELGAGYAARTVNADAALRKFNSLPARFVVVEADETHFGWAKDHFLRNGIAPDAHWFLNTLVSGSTTPQMFVSAAGRYCNTIPGAGAIETIHKLLSDAGILNQAMMDLMTTGRIEAQFDLHDNHYNASVCAAFRSSLDLNTILQPLGFVDYLDVDIQFAEREVIPASVWQLNDKVRRLHIGTHSQEIHEELEELLLGHGWQPVFSFLPDHRYTTPYGEFSTSDGILTFVNPRQR